MGIAKPRKRTEGEFIQQKTFMRSHYRAHDVNEDRRGSLV